MTKPVFDDEFKQGVVDYANQHPEESKVSIAKSFGIADSTIHKWIKDANNNDNKIESRGSGNFSSDEAKEIARLRKYTGCVRSVKKGYWHTGKINKTDIYKAVKEEKQKKTHKESYEIYGSPKITELLNKKGDKVSQKYVYSIMKENNIKAKYIKPYIQTTISHDFSDKLKNLLNRHYNPTKPNVTW